MIMLSRCSQGKLGMKLNRTRSIGNKNKIRPMLMLILILFLGVTLIQNLNCRPLNLDAESTQRSDQHPPQPDPALTLEFVSFTTSRGDANSEHQPNYIIDDYYDEFKIAHRENVILDQARGELKLFKIDKIIGDEGFDSGSLLETSDGGYLIYGATQINDTNHDIWLIKLDQFGIEQWNKTNGAPILERTTSAQETADGGFIITGYSGEYDSYGSYGSFILKTDSLGNQQWYKTYTASHSLEAYSIKQTSDSGYIITGRTDPPDVNDEDVWLLKVDADGNEQLNLTYGGGRSDMGLEIEQMSDGGYLIFGETYSFGNGEYDIWIINVDKDGVQNWNMTFGDQTRQEFTSYAHTSDGGYAIVGTTGDEIWLIKLNSNFNLEWDEKLDGDRGNSIQQTKDGGYIIAGWKRFKYGPDIVIIKTNSTGKKEWDVIYGKPNRDYPHTIYQVESGGYLVIAKTHIVNATTAGAYDIWMFNLDKYGNYNPDGEIISTNLLGMQNATSILTFNTWSSKPSNTTIKIQFSQNTTSWYSSNSKLNDWDILQDGFNTLDLSPLKWQGSNFYYKLSFSSENNNLPSIEYINLTYTQNPDTDGDNIPDPDDTDDDDDGFDDEWEEYLEKNPKNSTDKPLDTDSDGQPDGDSVNSHTWMDIDDDNDGLPDIWELQFGLNTTNYYDAEQDKDNDGFSNKEEYDADTDPTNPDDYPIIKIDRPQVDIKIILISVIIIIIIILISLITILYLKKKNKKL